MSVACLESLLFKNFIPRFPGIEGNQKSIKNNSNEVSLSSGHFTSSEPEALLNEISGCLYNCGLFWILRKDMEGLIKSR